jgi:hypothetical protein
MMNMIELQDKLKNFSQDQLVSMMQQPTGEAPQFMVLSEITRRQKMQKEAESQQAPTSSVAQEAVAAAGVPQGGIADMARSLAPQTNVAQNTGVNPAAPPQGMPMPSAPQGPAPMAAAPQGIARMASGGVIKMQAAGKIDYARYRELARRLIRDGSFSPEELKELEQIQNSNEFDNALAIEAELANSESLSDINPALPRVESSAPTPVFDATVEVPSLNQAPAADAAMKVVYDPKTNVPAAPSGLAALSPAETMPTVDGPFAYPESRFSTNLGSRAMLDWEEGQAEEAALIDARTNADLGSGRTPRYDTAIGPQPTSKVDSSGMDLVSMLRAQEDARTNAALGSGRTPRYDTAIGPQPAPPAPPPAPPAPSLEEVMDQFGVNRADAQAIIDRTYTPRINGEGSPFAVNENAPTGTRDAYSMIFGPLPAPYFNSELTAAEKDAAYKKEKARREEETAAFAAAAETPPSVTPNIDNITDEELAKYTNKRPQPRPKDLFAPTTDNAREGGGSGTGTGSGTGSGGMSDYETELMKIMKSREKAAESDKWLALAQVGMGLMQGGSGSFLGDVGAAGMKGLETLRTSRDQADTDKLSLLKAREDARIDRARIAASAAKGSAYDVNDYVKLLADLATQKQTIMADPSTTSAEKELAVKDITIEEARIRALMFPGRASSTPKPQTLDATKPPGLISKAWNYIAG